MRIKHRVTIQTSLHKPGAKPVRRERSQYTPVCSCGWSGESTTNRSSADENGGIHIVCATRAEQ